MRGRRGGFVASYTIAATACDDDDDCSAPRGACVDGACACTDGWFGNACGEAHCLRVETAARAYLLSCPTPEEHARWLSALAAEEAEVSS